MRNTTTHQSEKNPARHPRHGFTLIEVLVVIGLVVVLSTILLVALAASTERAGVAKTRTLMSSMSQATSQFRRDHNMLPPILGPRLGPQTRWHTRDFPLAVPQNADELQGWYSFTSPAEYLLGYGDALQDGKFGLGIRSPGIDGVWGSSADPNRNGYGDMNPNLNERNPILSGEGQVYGPYLEIDANDLLAKINGIGPNGAPLIVRPNDAGYSTLSAPLVILDYFGQPIHYYRKHPIRGFDLGDVYVLRPFDIKSGSEAQSQYADATGDTFTTFGMKSAQFAFMSSGPDLQDNHQLRFDDPDDGQNNAGTEFVNEDNIVEVGK